MTHQLVGDIGVVSASHALSNGRLHQTRERGQHVDGREDLPVVQLPVNVDLTLCNIACQVRDGVSDVYERERESSLKGWAQTPQYCSIPSTPELFSTVNTHHHLAWSE